MDRSSFIIIFSTNLHTFFSIHRKKKDGGCPFYHNTVTNQTKPTWQMERYGFMAVVPTLTALLLSSFNYLNIFLSVSIRSFRVFVRKAL